jgi:hypothetical protein
MATVGRNDPCPCGSGKKHKKCCAIKTLSDGAPTERSIEPIGLQPALRMKGGVMFEPQLRGYIAIVHSWDNAECRGEPTEWRDPKVFTTEDAAMRYYKSSIRPSLERLMAQLKKDRGSVSTVVRRLEE